MASMKKPVYTAKIIKSDGTKYRLKGVTTDLTVSHAKDELAEKVTISLVNVKVGTKKLHNLIALKDKIYVYANTGDGAKEVFRGFVWERTLYSDNDSDELTLGCYDRLIYLHYSKGNLFVKKGKTTKDVITSLAKSWGFKINYKYESISHSKLAFHNESIADIFISILDKAKKKTGKGYVIRLEKNVIVIEPFGNNSTVYRVDDKKNAMSTQYRQTMNDMVTKVTIVKAETVKKKSKKSDSETEEETGKYLTVTSLSKNTDKYGTLQEILVKNKDDNLSEIKKEAQEILAEKAKPTEEFEIKAIDNPWVKKGHKIYVDAGIAKNNFIVKGIEHDTVDCTMYLEVSKA